jgi:hypothetical protein
MAKRQAQPPSRRAESDVASARQAPATKRRRAPGGVATRGTVPGNGGAHRAPTAEEIAEAAYHRYLSRGAHDGADFDDWIAAEQELRSRSKPKSQ